MSAQRIWRRRQATFAQRVLLCFALPQTLLQCKIFFDPASKSAENVYLADPGDVRASMEYDLFAIILGFICVVGDIPLSKVGASHEMHTVLYRLGGLIYSPPVPPPPLRGPEPAGARGYCRQEYGGCCLHWS